MEEKRGDIVLDIVDDFVRKVIVNARKNAMSAVLAMSERNIVRMDLSIVDAFF